MAYLQTVEGGEKPSKIPDRPKTRDAGEWSITTTVPFWLMPIAACIGNGVGSPEAINGIGFTEPEGDLLLYRRVTAKDRERFPQLEGIAEVWVSFRLRED